MAYTYGFLQIYSCHTFIKPISVGTTYISEFRSIDITIIIFYNTLKFIIVYYYKYNYTFNYDDRIIVTLCI